MRDPIPAQEMRESGRESPLDFRVFPEKWDGKIGKFTIIFLILGISARLFRYLLNFPLWPDETFLAANFINGIYSDLLGPLAYHQVAPLLFLWLEQLFVNILGFSELTLRLFPALAGMAAVVLFFLLARKLAGGATLLLAVALLAVSYFPIRHSAEVKPYSTDLLITLILLLPAVSWWRRPERTRPLWLLTALAPIAVGLSFPAVFVGGGVSLGILVSLAKNRMESARAAWIAYTLVLGGSFLAMYALSTGPQYRTEQWLSGPAEKSQTFHNPKYRDGAWVKTFPPLDHPAELPLWLIKIHSGMLFAYPNGGRNGGSALTLVLFIVGAVVLTRRKGWDLLTFFLAPFLLALIAAAFHRYPYGYNARFNLYFAPIICLLAGIGAARVFALIRRERIRLIATLIFLSILALFAIGNISADLIQPYKNLEDLNSRRFARRFWTEEARNAELVCVYTDLGRDFFPRLWEWGNSSRYLCHQAIYSPRHRNGPCPPRWELVSPDHPLKCVVFSVPENLFPHAALDRAAREAWLEEMAADYRLVGLEKEEVNPDVRGHHEVYEVYYFIPKED